MVEKHYGRYFPQTGDGSLLEAALSGGRNVKPSRLRETGVAAELLDSVVTTRASEQATRRSRTGDLLTTKPEQGETQSNQDELSPQKTEDSD